MDEPIEAGYYEVLKQWEEEGHKRPTSFTEKKSADDFITSDDRQFVAQTESRGYDMSVYHWKEQHSVTVEIDIEQSGLYEIGFEYYPLSDGIVPIEGALQIDGEYPFSESRRIEFSTYWQHASDSFETDRYGNEIIPEQIQSQEWQYTKAVDSNQMNARPLQYYFSEGTHEITLINLREELLLGSIEVTSVTERLTYDEYRSQLPEGELVQDLLTVEAEHPYEKNSSYIRPIATQDPSVYPYDTSNQLLNTFGGESWTDSGHSVSWKVDVEKSGYYQLTFKAMQNKESHSPVFRQLSINGQVPFLEVESYPFLYDEKWVNETLGNNENEPYLFYLQKGENIITLTADASPYQPSLYEMNQMMRRIEEMALSIKQLTGNQQDRSRGWRINEYIPDIEERLVEWAESLEGHIDFFLPH